MPEVDQSKEVKVEKVEEVEVEGKTEELSDEWLDILGSGGLKKKVLKAGIVDSRPVKGDTVVIQANGRLEDGTEVDKHTQLTFTVGDGEVIVGLDMIVPLMDKGEVADVFIEPRFAFGSKGLPPNVPGDVNLIYKVELLDFGPEKSPSEIPIDQRMIIGNRKRERGNWWFNRQEYPLAIQCYSAAIDFLDDAEEEYGDEVKPEVQGILEERLKALNNMGAAQIKVEAYEVALKSFEAVLRCQPCNVKALFRKGKVLGLQGKFKESVVELKKALELEPEARPIHQELARIREKMRVEAESEKSLYRKMLGIKNEFTQENQKYPVLKSFPFKSWLMIFFSLLGALLAYRYRKEAMQLFQ
ncbi:peptidyl-prolyl cis-trans isomerase FKBP8 [Palaemon carinicauda]|uniref:peptidyl-prolyl cis-trans isomerase FKBP8 n=1 Tax=Palaemon carinicauda TaxID=392227 RepID=UPI0035B67D61